MPGFFGLAIIEANTEQGWSSPPYPALTTPEPLSITIGLYSPPSAILINIYLQTKALAISKILVFLLQKTRLIILL